MTKDKIIRNSSIDDDRPTPDCKTIDEMSQDLWNDLSNGKYGEPTIETVCRQLHHLEFGILQKKLRNADKLKARVLIKEYFEYERDHATATDAFVVKVMNAQPKVFKNTDDESELYPELCRICKEEIEEKYQQQPKIMNLLISRFDDFMKYWSESETKGKPDKHNNAAAIIADAHNETDDLNCCICFAFNDDIKDFVKDLYGTLKERFDDVISEDFQSMAIKADFGKLFNISISGRVGILMYVIYLIYMEIPKKCDYRKEWYEKAAASIGKTTDYIRKHWNRVKLKNDFP